MLESVNNRTTGEKILIWSLIIIGILTFLLGSYALFKSVKVAKNPVTTTVSSQDVEKFRHVISCKFDSLNSTVVKRDSVQNVILTEIMSSVDKADEELRLIDKRLNRIVKETYR